MVQKNVQERIVMHWWVANPYWANPQIRLERSCNYRKNYQTPVFHDDIFLMTLRIDIAD